MEKIRDKSGNFVSPEKWELWVNQLTINNCHPWTSICRASPILLALGISPEVAMNAIRLSVGRRTSKEDVDIAIEDLRQAVSTLES